MGAGHWDGRPESNEASGSLRKDDGRVKLRPWGAQRDERPMPIIQNDTSELCRTAYSSSATSAPVNGNLGNPPARCPADPSPNISHAHACTIERVNCLSPLLSGLVSQCTALKNDGRPIAHEREEMLALAPSSQGPKWAKTSLRPVPTGGARGGKKGPTSISYLDPQSTI